MKISRTWLNDFVECDDLSPEKLYELITTKVAEVDGVHTVGAPLTKAVAAKIVSVRAHPAKDTLKIATVSLGGTEAEVVCGAPNCREGLLTGYVPPGGVVHAGGGEKIVTVETRDVQGVMSTGVLASEAELGLTGAHAGIIELSDGQPGQALSDLLGAPDTVIEIDNKSLTHRPDLWSHLGFARELSAILGRPLKLDADCFADDRDAGKKRLQQLGSGKPNFSIEIDPASKSRRFTAVEITGVKAEPSPLWMRRRLFAVGAGIRNLLVDLSNYVMHDIGQPNHAYDADLLKGSTISVRPAKSGEPFLGLDGIERKLAPEDVVIADASGPVALAGVIGGQLTAVNDGTTRLLLESANFDPVVLRLTTKRQQVRTDASNRFEKSRSPYAVPLALHRFTELLIAIQPSAKIVGAPAEDFPSPPNPVRVPFSFDYIRTRLDPAVDQKIASQILSSLGFALSENGKGEWEAVVPYERATRDISIQDDLVEEVGRIFGYENVSELAPSIQSVARPGNPLLELENLVRDRLAGLGFSEAYQYSFMSRERAEQLGYRTSSAVELLNPIDSNSTLIRTTLVPGAIELLERNGRFFSDVMLFELGRAYELPDAKQNGGKKKGQAAGRERRLLSLSYMSGIDEKDAGAAARPKLGSGASFYAAAAVLRSVLRLVSKNAPELAPLQTCSGESSAEDFHCAKAWMHPHRAASVMLKGECVGVIAEISPLLGVELPARAVLAEIDLGKLLALPAEAPGFEQLAKYPDSFFEMSVVMPRTEHYRELDTFIRMNADSEILKRIDVLAVYEGKPLKEGEKSVSVRLVFGSRERTLAGEEISGFQTRLIDAVRNSRYALRG